MKFDFSDAAKAKEGGRYLSPGIKDATFQGVEFATVTSQKTGDTYKTLALKLEIEGYGDYTQNFFEPESDERQEMQWGLSASQLDHFKISVMEILEAVNPEVVKKINSGELSMTGSFKQIVDFVKKYTEDKVGTLVQVKLIPGSNGFVSMPQFPARITKNGDLGISTRIIGHDLTLTTSEVKKIEAASKAKPTDMAKSTSQVLTDMGEDPDLNVDREDSDDDLPF